jgi:Holliday junction resolvasome RuvABC DNA-binding subunit
MKHMNLIPFGNVNGFLILGTLHMVYYLAILEMGKPSQQNSSSHVNRQPRKKTLPIKLTPEPTGITNDVRSDVLKALQQLGHTRKNSHEMMDIILKRYPNLKTSSEILRTCIKESSTK